MANSGTPAAGAPRPRAERITMLLENNPYPQDVRVRSEAETLAAAGHHVTVLAPRDAGQPRRERVNGVDVIRFRLTDGGARGKLGFVTEYLTAGLALHAGAIRQLWRGATVLHIHNPPDIFFPAAALYRLAGRRVVFDHHDLFPETIDVKLGIPWVARVAAWCQRLTIGVAHHVIATNESYAEVARHAGKAAGDVTIVRNGPPASWLSRPATGRDGMLSPVRVAYLGAMSVQDGVDGLAHILARIRERDPALTVHLRIIGEGDARAALAADLAARGLADSVEFTGRVAPERVPEMLAGADICLDPAPPTDVNHRSTMTKVAEYLSLGKPIVAYDLRETRRTVAEAGLLVRPGDLDGFADAIRLLAGDPALRARLAAAARHRATSLTWDHSARALLGAYAVLRARRDAGAETGPGLALPPAATPEEKGGVLPR